MQFDRNPFMCLCEGEKGINDFKFGTFIGRFKSDSGTHGSESVTVIIIIIVIIMTEVITMTEVFIKRRILSV